MFLVGGNRICAQDGRVFTGKIQKLRLFGSCFLYYCKRRLPAKRKHRQSLKAARSLVFEKVSLRYPRSAGWFDRTPSSSQLAFLKGGRQADARPPPDPHYKHSGVERKGTGWYSRTTSQFLLVGGQFFWTTCRECATMKYIFF